MASFSKSRDTLNNYKIEYLTKNGKKADTNVSESGP